MWGRRGGGDGCGQLVAVPAGAAKLHGRAASAPPRWGRFEPNWLRPRCALHIASRCEPTPKPALRFGFLREARYEAMTCPTTSGWCNARAVLLKSVTPFKGSPSTSAFVLHVAGLALPFLRRQERKQATRMPRARPLTRSGIPCAARRHGPVQNSLRSSRRLSSVQTAGPSQMVDASAEALAPMAAVLLSEA